MPILTQPAFGPKLSIGFITGGVLLGVWSIVWRFTIAASTLSPEARFWFFGVLLSGVTFTLIGVFLGNIGRAARKAELPPTDETVRAEEQVQKAQPQLQPQVVQPNGLTPNGTMPMTAASPVSATSPIMPAAPNS